MSTSWLPPEVGGVCQPYSMLPLFRRLRHDPHYASPALGTLVPMDRSDLRNPRNGGVSLPIRMALVAPSNVQRAAQAAGVTQMVMIRPKGIEKVDPRLRSTREAQATAIADMIEGLD